MSLRVESAPAPPADATGTHPAIVVAGVSKQFVLPHQRYTTLKERALHPFRSDGSDVLQVLRRISFDVEQGEFFGVVGRNGSGKSTLLKCMAGIYDVDDGELDVRGRLSPFIELGVGFNPELTARDNVLVNAAMLGLSRKAARERFDDIIAFAGLEDFVDLKLKNYSSGMSVRLAFAVAIEVDADIVLVDEVLAVGDAAFQQKCFDEFQRMKDAGTTIVFVTHDMGMVERFCDRALLLEKGDIVEIGAPSVIARRYNELNFGRAAHELPPEDTAAADEAGEPVDRTRPVEITSGWFEDWRGERVVALGQDETLRARFEVSFNEPVHNPIFALTLRNDARATVLVIRTDWRHGPTGDFAAGDRAVATFQFNNVLGPSRYSLTASVARDGAESDALAMAEDLVSLVVHATVYSGGVVDIPHEIAVDRL